MEKQEGSVQSTATYFILLRKVLCLWRFYDLKNLGTLKKFGVNRTLTPENIKEVWRKMIVKGKYNYKYSTVNFKSSIAKRFRMFSKKISKSHSESIRIIMDFFEWHGFLPSDKFERSMLQEIIKNRKRTEAIIAIIKSIEKEQTKPTTAMLLSLFEENLKQEKKEPLMVEKKFADKQLENKPVENTTVPKIRYERLTEKMNLVKQNFSDVLNKVKTVKSSFGKNYFKLELSEEELTKLKRTLQNL
ncbi:BfmA/BtgA family mobilization protein [Aureibaculum luteum]|uniref:BfmA/BtgA family mobilization protein n=1 Tax=Aureibaculum luteum TaxID=1548456 RepID=UPI000E4C2539|nr:BfmA/BtgA family mobilization protein [Aureibaculum luteum]